MRTISSNMYRFPVAERSSHCIESSTAIMGKTVDMNHLLRLISGPPARGERDNLHSRVEPSAKRTSVSSTQEELGRPSFDSRLVPPILTLGEDSSSRKLHALSRAELHEFWAAGEHSPGAGEDLGDEVAARSSELGFEEKRRTRVDRQVMR